MAEEKNVIVDNKAVPVSDTQTALSWSAATPAWATNLFNIWVALSGATALIMMTFSDMIPDDVEGIVNRCLVLGIGLIRIFTKSFGIELKEK